MRIPSLFLSLNNRQTGDISTDCLPQVSTNHGAGIQHGATQIMSGVVSVTPITDAFVYMCDANSDQTHRNAVLQIMTSFIPIKNVRSSKCLTNIEQRPDKVILEFADGDVAEASTLVGADGIKSIVREHVLRPLYPSQVEPVYADSYCYRGVIPTSEAKEIFGDLTDIAKMYLGDKRCCVTCLISKGDVSRRPSGRFTPRSKLTLHY